MNDDNPTNLQNGEPSDAPTPESQASGEVESPIKPAEKPKISLPNIPRLNNKSNPFGNSKPIVPKISSIAAPTPNASIEEDSAPTEAMSIEDLQDMEHNSGIFVSPGVLGDRSSNHDLGGGISGGELGNSATEMEEIVEIDDIEPLTVEIDVDPPTDNLSADDIENMVIPPMRDEDDHAGLMVESIGHNIQDDMDEEPTSLLSMSDGVLLSDEDVNLDDFEEEGATVVFDSFSGTPINALDDASPPSKHPTQLGMQAPNIQTSFNQPNPNNPQGPWSPTASSPSLQQPQPYIEQPVESTGLQDDFASQATEVLHSPFERELMAPKLRFLDGPIAGKDAFITGIKGTFGRGENNTNMIADLAMSRNHFEIIKQPDESYLIKDLGSSNGTALNNTLIREAALFHGDRIEAGKSVMVFEYEEAVAKPHRHLLKAEINTLQGNQLDDKTSLAAIQIDQTTRLLTRISIAAAILCMPLIGMLLFLSLRSPKQTAQPAQTPNGTQSQKADAAQLYLKGVDAVKARDWDLARAHFKRAQASDPNLDIKAQLALIQREQFAQKALSRATTLSQANKQDEVNRLVSTIPAESVYFVDAQKLKIQKRRDDLNELYKSAQTKFTNDELDDAQKFAEEVLKLSPQHAGSKTLLASIAKRRIEIEKAQAKEKEKAQANNTPAVNPFDQKPKPTTIPVNATSGNLQEGLALYKSGKFSKAAQVFDNVGSGKGKRLARSARQLQSSFQSGKSAFGRKQWSKAISQLTRAKRADNALGRAFKSDISSRLATAHAELGLSHVSKGKYRDARKSLVAGTRHQKNAKTRALSKALEDKARSLYIKAANTKKSNPDAAGIICRKIMLMVPSSSPTWKKAQRLMLEF